MHDTRHVLVWHTTTGIHTEMALVTRIVVRARLRRSRAAAGAVRSAWAEAASLGSRHILPLPPIPPPYFSQYIKIAMLRFWTTLPVLPSSFTLFLFCVCRVLACEWWCIFELIVKHLIIACVYFIYDVFFYKIIFLAQIMIVIKGWHEKKNNENIFLSHTKFA